MSVLPVFKRSAPLLGAMLVWFFAVGAGARVLLRYSETPGRLAVAQPNWPGAGIARGAPGRDRLVLFLHPHCPCSRATVGELALLMARCHGRVDALVYFYAPRTKGTAWVRSDLWEDVAQIPGVRAVEDRDGTEVRRFGALTSGQTLLYDPRGVLLFNGGITFARGHAGSNDGRDAIVSFIESGAAARRSTPVFGCSLLGGE